MNAQTVDICICTYGRSAEVLEDCLTSLERQRYPHNRLNIQVFDANPKSLKEEIDFRVFKIPIRWIHLGRRISMPIVRHIAIETASSNYIAFIDDDCVATDGWLLALVDQIQSDSSIGAVQGKVLPFSAKTFLERFADFDCSQAPTYRNNDIVNVCTCNCIIRTEAINEAHLHLELYRRLQTKGLYFAFEDYLISQAVLQSGFMLSYNDDAVVYHRHPETLTRKLKQFKGYGRGACAYCYVSGTPFTELPGYPLPQNINTISFLWNWLKEFKRIANKYPCALSHNSPWSYRVAYPLLCWLIQGAYYYGFWAAIRDIENCSIFHQR